MQTRHPLALGLLIVLCLASSPAVLRGMRAAAADTPNVCRGMDAKLAHATADAAFRNSQYRRAGQCYLIAGDNPKANLAFIKATAADAPGVKRQLADNAKQVKDQFRQFRQLREAMTSH